MDRLKLTPQKYFFKISYLNFQQKESPINTFLIVPPQIFQLLICPKKYKRNYLLFKSAKYNFVYISSMRLQCQPLYTRLRKTPKSWKENCLLPKMCKIQDIPCDYNPLLAYQCVLLSGMSKIINTPMAIQFFSRKLFVNNTMNNIKNKCENVLFLCFSGNSIFWLFSCISKPTFSRLIPFSCSNKSNIPILNVRPQFYLACFFNKIKITQILPVIKLLPGWNLVSHLNFTKILFLIVALINHTLILSVFNLQILHKLCVDNNYLSNLSKKFEINLLFINFILLFCHMILVRTRINKFKQYLIPCGRVLVDSAHFFKNVLPKTLIHIR